MMKCRESLKSQNQELFEWWIPQDYQVLKHLSNSCLYHAIVIQDFEGSNWKMNFRINSEKVFWFKFEIIP